MNITIGIPAYNEAVNIKQLLQTLLVQKTQPFTLKKIIVISDGSTDNTVALAREISDSRVKIISGRKNLGLASRQNQLFHLIDTPIAVLLDADTLPQEDDFLSQLCMPLLNNNSVGITSAAIIPTPPNNFISSTLSWHHQWKNHLYQSINNGDNIFLCHGRARAFSKPLYQKLLWPKGYGEDAYSYIFAKQNGFQFQFAEKARLYCSTPNTISDHLHQSSRFLHSVKKNQTIDSNTNWYHIPVQTLLRHMGIGFLTHPIYAISYILLMLASFVVTHIPRNKQQSHLWTTASSTKTLNI